MSRRVRAGHCPWCGGLTALNRKSPQPEHETPLPAITICGVCFGVFGNARVQSRLVERQELRG